MRAPLQEKFQISAPSSCAEKEEGWASFSSVRQDQSCVPQGEKAKLNYAPPGMDISNQYSVEINDMPLGLAGTTDISADTNPMALANGFTRREMKGIDDQYTGEHVDLFYGDAGGFAERNNYLDRE